ncbi:hypothetical protein RJ640_027894 [Escallonia rubra]|uniref:Uncharacterized protein n=1 Tax=Escallonia rubra TaxID=112253 RepID=A0AA88RLU2_9ASTE|nr:hypothetical protein RJ640_027894 [Escallonia rubra]
MSDPYGKAKGGRLTFKGGSLATRTKSIDKKHNKKKKKHTKSTAAATDEFHSEEAAGLATEEVEVEVEEKEEEEAPSAASAAAGGGGGDIYTIDAAKRRKYDELFPVEAKRFGYDPKSKAKSVEEALDDRVQKKADRYCVKILFLNLCESGLNLLYLVPSCGTTDVMFGTLWGDWAFKEVSLLLGMD